VFRRIVILNKMTLNDQYIQVLI